MGVMGRTFDDVYDQFGVPVHAFLARLTGNASTADELCQETFVRYLANERALAGRNGSLGPWLYRVATNLGIDRIRRRRGQAMDGDAVDPGAPSSQLADAKDVEACIRKAVLELEPALRATFLLRAHHGLSFRQVGGVLGVSERSSKDRYRRVRERLMRRLAHLIEEDE